MVMARCQLYCSETPSARDGAVSPRQYGGLVKDRGVGPAARIMLSLPVPEVPGTMMLFLIILAVFVTSVAVGSAIGSALGSFVLDSRMRDDGATSFDDTPL